MTNQTYIGSELELFAHALNWKAYYRSHLQRYLVGDVLEVGAGIGGTTQVLCDGRQRSWLCLEPDPRLVAQLTARVDTLRLPIPVRVQTGVVADLAADQLFDCILYIDVLEHIEDDSAEVERAMRHLKPGGHLVVLGPAHNWLFSEFDRSVGHYRRYNRTMLQALRRSGLPVVESFYLDAAGTLVNLAARFVFKSGQPTHGQIALWDKFIVPVSRVLDPLLGWRLGKTAIAVFRFAPAGGHGATTSA